MKSIATLWLPLLFMPGTLSIGQVAAKPVFHLDHILPFAVKGAMKVTQPTAQTSAGATAAITEAEILAVNAGRSLETSSDGETSLILGAAGTARMLPDSQVKVPAPREGYSLEQLKGRLFIQVNAQDLAGRGNAEFKLKTPTALLAVKGTRFFSKTSTEGDLIGVFEGSVEVTEPQSQAKTTLPSGMAVLVKAGSLGQSRPLTEAEKGETRFIDLASIDTLPVKCVVYEGGRASLFKEGKISVVSTSWDRFSEMPPSVWLSKRTMLKGQPKAELKILSDGVASFSWESSPSSTAGILASINLQLRGQGLEFAQKASGVSSRIIAVRCRYLASDVANLYISNRGRNSQDGRDMQGSLPNQTSGPYIFFGYESPAWRELVAPIRSLRKLRPEALAEGLSDHERISITMQRASIKDRRVKPFIQMKEFELLLTPESK